MNRIKTPTLLIDPEKCLLNIQRMKQKADSSGVILRPHFKTHQSADIGEWFRTAGICCITVSSVNMAVYFAAHGWDDITIAFPVNIRELEEINKLASTIRLNILLESVEVAHYCARSLSHSVGYFIETDTGYHRSGVDPKNFQLIEEIIKACNSNTCMTFKGFLAHAGQSYMAAVPDDIITIYREGTRELKNIHHHFLQEFPDIIVSWGDTPTCSIVEKFDDVNEIRPGNFVFYDVMQLILQTCKPRDIAIAVACPVIAKYSDRRQLVIHGGAIHLSKENTIHNGNIIFGLIALPAKGGWGNPLENMWINSLSQEHGVISIHDSELMKKINPGDLLFVYPVHSCLTADLMRKYHTLDGNIMECMKKE